MFYWQLVFVLLFYIIIPKATIKIRITQTDASNVRKLPTDTDAA